ncbi:hypothetical protein P7C71_g3051, partial [Lecanoromycetidae sp. Uapishka_2]
MLTPPIFKPFLGYLIAVPVYIWQRKSYSYLIPIIRDRMRDIVRQRGDSNLAYQAPIDMITGVVATALDNQSSSPDFRPEALAEHLLFMTLATTHTTIMTITNTFLDLLSANPEAEYCETLREEAEAVFQKDEDWLSSASLSRLVCIDSTIREALRKHPVLTRTNMREVVRTGGLDLPHGQNIPQGAWVAAPVVPIHHDERFYTNPNGYDPFRFVEKPNDDLSGIAKSNLKPSDIHAKSHMPQGVTTTSSTFLAFGHGRHSCPGRWYAAMLMKLVVAYIVINYDIQPLKERPHNWVFGDSMIPSRTATIKVRRRKGE